MRSATDFLPSYIRQFMNLVTTASPNLASGRTSRLTAARRRDMTLLLALLNLLRPLGAVFGAPLAAVLDALGIERATDDMVAHTRQILDAAAANQHDRMLLKVMPLAGDVARHLETVGEAHARDFAQRRIGLLRRDGVDARADTTLLRRARQRRDLVARHLRAARLVHQLIDRRHALSDLIKRNRRATCFPHRRHGSKGTPETRRLSRRRAKTEIGCV